MATMDDIARQLGISKGTVSKALSGASDISETMRKTVLETAVELGYSRIPRAKNAPKVCVFIENMKYEKPEDFGWDLVTGFRKLAEPAGYLVDLVKLDEINQKEVRYDEYMLMNNYLGGFFLGVTLSDPWINDFRTCHTPTVLFDNKVPNNPMVVHVGIDNDEAMNFTISRLKDLGHKKIGYLSASLGSYVFQERYLAFFRALKKNNLDSDKNLAGHSYFTSECMENHLPRIIELGCTAIICSHDLLAHSAMIHLAEKGFRIPEDISIVGIDDLSICQYTTPTLSSIRQDRTELGKSAYYALSCQINKIHINTLLLHPEIIFRGSTGPAPEK